MKIIQTFLSIAFFVVSIDQLCAFAQMDSLKTKLAEISTKVDGNVGVSVISLESGDTLSLKGDDRFPMQSVYKFPLAIAVLDQVDKEVLSLNQKIFLKEMELLPNTWSPLREKYPDGNVNITLDELLNYTVSVSDNNGCDILFRLLGGPAKVNEYFHGRGNLDISIVATEEEMHKDWAVQFTNWSTPNEMGNLLTQFYKGKILSKKSTNYLKKIMIKTSTGPKRIKGLLPRGTIVAHKTGSSGRNEEGMIGALNDVGIVTLPNGKHFAVAVFISNTKTDEAICESVIAEIAKTVWDWYVEKR